MKIYFGQVYVEVDANFPFSYHFQAAFSDAVTRLVPASDAYEKKYGKRAVMFNVSAKRGTRQNEVKGPAVFKDSKTVEFTIFLPYDVITAKGKDFCQPALNFLLDG